MKTIDDLKLEMPHVFELLEMLKRKIAEADAAYYADLERFRQEINDPDRYDALVSDKAHRHHLSLKPMRMQIQAILGSIADILACEPLPPIVVPSGHHFIA